MSNLTLAHWVYEGEPSVIRFGSGEVILYRFVPFCSYTFVLL